MSSFYRSNNGIAFEIEIARRLQALGWDTTDTARTGDFGADIIAKCGRESLVVQCKDWAGPAGFSAVKEVHAARTYYSANQAIVVSKSGYTRQALKAAQTFNISLYTPNDLVTGIAIDRSAKYHEQMRYRYEQRRSQSFQSDEEFHRVLKAGEQAWLNQNYLEIRRKLMIKRLPIVFFILLLTYYLYYQNVFLALLSMIFLPILFLNEIDAYFDGLKIVTPMSSNNGKALLLCPKCKSLLRLPVARLGFVSCSICKKRFRASTC